jgi:hypothetical protein
VPRPLLAFAGVAATACALGCATVVPRFPTDVQTAVVRDDMRRMETDQLVLYYPAPRRALAERVAARLEGCATALRAAARVDNALTRRKFTIVLPEAPFNNAYVFPPALGIEDVSVIPTGDTLDFTTAFGLPPDPGMTGCHELTHYVHLRQIGGLWRVLDTVFGDLGTPQGGFDLWFLEGLATYYEARLVPGVGRPRWPGVHQPVPRRLRRRSRPARRLAVGVRASGDPRPPLPGSARCSSAGWPRPTASPRCGG